MNNPAPRISVVITCFNYERFIALAVRSALEQQPPPFEVIVVNDGSSDGSAGVLAGFGERIQVINQANQGQIAATNRGFAASRGDLVMFLDADDLLCPGALAMLMSGWAPGCVKVQGDLEIIDTAGERLGRRFCNYVAPYGPPQIAAEFERFGTYVWPVSTGNLYARDYLAQVMPLTAEMAPDGVLNTLAPLYGEIRVVPQVIGLYRLHDANQSYHNSAVQAIGKRFARQVALRRTELAGLREVAATRGAKLPSGQLLDHDLPFVNYRLMLKKLGEPYAGAQDDTPWGLWRAGITCLWQRPLPLKLKLSHAAWLSILWASPRPLAQGLITLRFNRAAILQPLRRALARLTKLNMPSPASSTSSWAPSALPSLPPPLPPSLTPAQSALRLAVIIPSYNYAEFVGLAIDSALAIDWPNKQVIVVDDGSTDASREVIARYSEQITTVLQANAGQREAYNAGMRLAQADVVIFLDSDDMLDPQVMREVAALWRPGVSKVQFRMRTVDAAGRWLGNIIPQYHGIPTAQEIRTWATTTTAYPTPPGSGNAYASTFLQAIFPLTDASNLPGDAPCLAAAPILGDVATLPKVLASYRIHGRNDGAASRLDPAQFHLHVVRTLQRHVYAQRIARQVGIEVADNAVNASLSYLPYRMASLRLSPATHPIAHDSALKILIDVLRALPQAQGMSPRNKTVIAVWSLLVTVLPKAAGNRLILWRFVPAARPQALRTTLLKLGVIR